MEAEQEPIKRIFPNLMINHPMKVQGFVIVRRVLFTRVGTELHI